jgi:hypothetical protein
MGAVINIALLSLSFLGALAAFGGETWKRGEEPLRQRVTRRGWASITFLCLALLLGIVKEIRNSRETGGLTAQVKTLQDQLKQSRALLISQRLEDLAERTRKLSGYEERLAPAQTAFERYRSSSLSVGGRVAKEGFPPPPALQLSFASKDFRYDVCSADFSVAAKREFKQPECTESNLAALAREISDTSFEQRALGPSVIAMLKYLADISIAHRDALNGPFSPGRTAPLISLESVLLQMPGECGSTPTEVARLASVLHVLETSAQRLHWLFVYGFPATPGSEKERNQDLLSTSTVFAYQMGRLDQITRDRDQPNKDTFRLGNFIENVATGYTRLITNVGDILRTCKARREQLSAEKSAIEKGQ